ncbi:MAG: sugar phosphate isomerase/epimerase [Clostridia bacterium]|nr:sugar phosphate isomerase/epimerase [Clostridia bacterium]
MDIGHAEMVNCEGAPKIIRALGKRIGCLHVHDNDLYDDLHTFPFSGDINWNEVAKALKDVGYGGNLTFEADAFMKNYPDELIADCLKLLERTGRYLINLIENS